jgi:ferredoxin
MSPSRFGARVDQKDCIGCRKCLERCPFGAVEMLEIPGSDKPKAHVIDEKCMGCGVCVISCKKEAMKFELIRPPDFIPPKPEMNFSMMPDLT